MVTRIDINLSQVFLMILAVVRYKSFLTLIFYQIAKLLGVSQQFVKGKLNNFSLFNRFSPLM